MSHRRDRAWGAASLLLPVALGLAGCTGDTGDSPRAAAPFNRGRQLAISDQLHNGGTAGFVFLPPMVPRPAYFGDFLPDLEPLVRIDEVRADGTTVRTLATFTRDSGPGRERIRVHRQGEACDRDDDDGDGDPNGYFYARWFTDHARLSTSAVYRVRVFVQERVHPCTRNGWGRRCRHGEDNTAPMREVGYADVDVVRNEREARFVDRDDYVPLVNGRVLRIKFRVDRPVVDADGDGVYNWRDNCRTTANPSQLDTDRDGEGDACECEGVVCAPTDACHAAGACSPTNGMCSNPAAPDGSACPLTNAAGVCAAGVCGAPTCSAGFGDCDGAAANGCEQPTNTTTHCGGCNVACTAGAHATATCATGTCGLVCAAGWFDADGDRANGCELDITTDADCGAPGSACVSGTGGTTTCVAGACSTMACPSGRANCNTAVGDGCEVALATDASHCGACGRACAVPNATAACSAGLCAVGACATGFADVNGDPADGCEVNLATDSSHCGAAGNVCSAPANGTAACRSGSCGIGSCASGFADVNGVVADGCEVSFATSPSHCGGLNNACSAPNGTAGCAMGRCTLAACDAGFASCDGSATNGCETATSSDVSNCGACGTACPAGANSAPTCTSGACGIACASGFADVNGSPADGCEVNLAADPSHCGRVGVACTQGRTCRSGACTSTTCASGLANCDGEEATGCEVTLATDANHCGACGRVCAFANARPDCVAGACTFTVCDLGFADVDGDRANGCEVNLATDANHCGAPNSACAFANASAGCVASACRMGACASGFADVNGAPADGCEVNLAADPSHCGAVGSACPTPANGTAACVGGSCAIGACASGFADVNRNPADGCEVSFATDVNHCGGLNRACSVANGTAGCAGGACVVASCGAGFADCDGGAANGCEVDTRGAVGHCGACGNACNVANGTAACVAGACAVAACNPSFSDCDGSAANGCEVNLASSASNCGACGSACALPGGANVCVSGSCAVSTCDPGLGNCDGSAANGCETALSSSLSHCGACNNACPTLPNATSACASGACGVGACSAGFANCDGVASNGCEAALATDVAHCGACGNACPPRANAARTCAAGACGFACNAGYRDCDGSAANGCEVLGSTCPRITWARSGLINVSSNDRGAEDLVADAAGNLYSAHRYFQRTSVDGTELPASFGGGGIVVSRTATGALRWTAQFDGVSGHMFVNRLFVDPASGDLYVAGGGWGASWRLNGTVRGALGGGYWTIARLRAADGSVVWARSLETGNDGQAHALAVGPAGEVYLGGVSQFQCVWDGINTGASGGYEAYVVRLDPATGGVVAAHRFGGAGNEYIYAIVPLAGGDYIAAGSATEPTTIGGVAIPRAAGNEAAFWLRANAAGAAQWVRYASTNRERVLHAAMGPTGHVYLSGLNEGNMTFGGVPVTASGTAYVARIDPSSGAPVWIDTTDVDWSEYFGIRRFVVDDSDVLHVTWWARSQSTASTFGGVNIGWTPGGGGWQSYVATVVGSTGAVTRIERFQDPSTLIQSRAIAISGGRNVISGVYWPQSGTGMVDGVSFPTYLTSGPHLDAFTAYLTF